MPNSWSFFFSFLLRFSFFSQTHKRHGLKPSGVTEEITAVSRLRALRAWLGQKSKGTNQPSCHFPWERRGCDTIRKHRAYLRAPVKHNTRFPTWRESVYGLEYGLLPKSATKPPFFQDALPKYPVLVLLNAKSKVENNYCRWLHFTGNLMSMCRLLHFWSLPKTFFMTTKAKIIPYLIQKKNKKKTQETKQRTEHQVVNHQTEFLFRKKKKKKKRHLD